MNGMLATLPHVQSGKLKVLGVSKRTRMPLIGDVPTIAEQGVPGFESGTWQGVLVANGTPAAVVQRLNAELITRHPLARGPRAPGGAGRRGRHHDAGRAGPFFDAERTRWAQGRGPGQHQARLTLSSYP